MGYLFLKTKIFFIALLLLDYVRKEIQIKGKILKI